MDIDVSSVEGFISSVAGSAIVTPQGVVGTGGFLFDIAGNEEVVLEAEATDHYVEDNTAVQDHIALRPTMITLKGYMGELTDKAQGYLANVLSSINSLGDIGGLAPSFASQAAQVYTKVESVLTKANAVISQANNIYSIFSKKSTTQTNGQSAFQFFKSLWEKRILCSVETPFQTFKSMMIVRVGAIGPEESKTISNFTVTFKEIRTTNTMRTTTKTAAGRASDMLSSAVEKGNIGSTTVENTFLASDSSTRTWKPKSKTRVV